MRDAARFFLDDLYGPEDFTRRDEQFARVVPGLVRLFPQEIVGTVISLGELHALSEQFDTAMARVDRRYRPGRRRLRRSLAHRRPAGRSRPTDRAHAGRGLGAGPLHPQSLDAHEPAPDARAGGSGRAGRVAGLSGTGLRHLSARCAVRANSWTQWQPVNANWRPTVRRRQCRRRIGRGLTHTALGQLPWLPKRAPPRCHVAFSAAPSAPTTSNSRADPLASTLPPWRTGASEHRRLPQPGRPARSGLPAPSRT